MAIKRRTNIASKSAFNYLYLEARKEGRVSKCGIEKARGCDLKKAQELGCRTVANPTFKRCESRGLAQRTVPQSDKYELFTIPWTSSLVLCYLGSLCNIFYRWNGR